MKKFWYLIPLIIFIGLVAFFWQGLHQNPHVIPSPLINKPMPTVDQYTVEDDPEVKIKNQDFLNHVTLLNVWASWCVSCQAEHSVLMDISRSGKVIIYGINYKDKRELAQEWLKKRGNPYVLDIYDPTGELGMNLGVYGTPETFLVDQYGIIRYKYIGPISPEVWQNELLPRVLKLQSQQ